MAGLRAIEVFRDARHGLIAIQAAELARVDARPFSRLFARIEPIALIVCDAEGVGALSLRSEPVDLGQLRRDVPGLDSMIASFRRS